MIRFLSLLTLLLAPALAAGAPAMVTTARGNVQLTTADGQSAAPAPPFLLTDGQSLTLPDQAEVVLLYEGIANHLVGPRSLTIADLATISSNGKASKGASALNDLMSKPVISRRAAASRDLPKISLMRPIAGTAVLQPDNIRWQCATCNGVKVELYDYTEDATLWTATGTAALVYTGPSLGPGAYAVVIDGNDFPFTVPTVSDAAAVADAQSSAQQATAALSNDKITPADKAAITATVYLQAGHPTAALQSIEAVLKDNPENAELKDLLLVFERRAGIRN